MFTISLITCSQVAINNDGGNPNGCSMLDVESTSRGLLIPRMSITQRNAIGSPATGLLVFQTNSTPGFYYNKGTPSVSNWINLSTDNLGNHIATQNLVLNGNYISGDGGSEGIFVNSLGRVGIGLTNPTTPLEVTGTIKATAFEGDGSNLTDLPGDNLGNHIATQNIRMSNKWISQDGDSEGIFVSSSGYVGIGTTSLSERLEVNGKVEAEDGFRINTAPGDGLYIYKSGTISTNQTSSYNNGVEVSGAQGYGLYVGYSGHDGIHVYNAGPTISGVNDIGDNGVEIEGAADYGVFVGHSGKDGVYVYKAGNPSATFTTLYENGFELAGAEGNGLYIGRADLNGAIIWNAGSDGIYIGTTGDDGIYISDVGDDGLHVHDAENNGIYIRQTGEDGVCVHQAGSPNGAFSSSLNNGFEVEGAEGHGLYIGKANNDGICVYNAGYDGITIETAGAHGVHVDEAASDGIHVKKAGTPTSTSSSPAYSNGAEIEGAEHYGMYVGYAGFDGLYIYEAADDGITVLNAADDGLYINDATADGVYVAHADDRAFYGNTDNADKEWGFFTYDKIYANNLTSKGNNSYAKNTGSITLEAGDIVCIAGGLTRNVLDGVGYPVVNVARATKGNSQAVFGVVEHKVVIREDVEETNDGGQQKALKSFTHADGDIYPGDYLSVVVFGQAEVKIDNRKSIKAGQKLTVSETSGHARSINNSDSWFDTGVLGKSLEDSDGKGMLTVFVNCK